MITWLQGKKTYIIAVVGIVCAWLAYLIGAPLTGMDHIPTLGEAIQLTFAALVGMGIRAGVTTEAVKVENVAADNVPPRALPTDTK